MTQAANSETDYAAELPCSKVKYYSCALSNVVCVSEFPDLETGLSLSVWCVLLTWSSQRLKL